MSTTHFKYNSENMDAQEDNKKEEKAWYLYEKQCMKRHKTMFPEQTVYHWENAPEDALTDCGFIRNKTNLRQKRKRYFEVLTINPIPLIIQKFRLLRKTVM